jgi:KDO2-lipid IV(A) lauroyltransferase
MGRIFMRLAAVLPLPISHAAGWALGWLMYLMSPRYRGHLNANLTLAGYGDKGHVRRQAIASAGRLLTELPALWLRPHAKVAGLVRRVEGLDLVEKAQAAGKGILFLTPHLGCFEITSQYGSTLFPMTVMYRPPKLRWLEPIMKEGRERPGVRLAPADLNGVRDLMFALRRQEAIGILPDQVPGVGEGEWAAFFGKPAYTMTLAPRLIARKNVACFVAFARRLPWGRGYTVTLRALDERRPDESDTRRLNRCLEDIIRLCPGQYLWGYNRYKVPAGSRAPE